MKYLSLQKTFYFTIIFIICLNINQLFCQNNNEKSKKTIVITPIYYLNKTKEYEYLADVIRDILKAKLITTEMFDFISFTVIDEKIKKYFKNEEDYVNDIKLMDLGKSVGGEVLLITKYTISNNKIMINTEVFDVILKKNIMTFSIYKDIGLQIFDIIDKIANDIKNRIIGEYKKIENIVNKEQEEIEKKKKTERQVIKLQNGLIFKYYGIGLGSLKKDIMIIIDNSFLKYKKKKDQIILFGNLAGYQNTKYTVFNFKDDKLIDIITFVAYPLQIGQETFSLIKEQLIDILGEKNKNTSDDKLEWELMDNKFEFSYILGAKGYILYYFHYSIINQSLPVQSSLKNITVEEKWFKNAMELCIGGNFKYSPALFNFLFLENYYFGYSYYQSFTLSSVLNFSYYLNPYFAIGFGYRFGYGINILTYSAPVNVENNVNNHNGYLYHDIYNELVISNKMGNPSLSNNKLLLEYGVLFKIRFVSDIIKFNNIHYVVFNSNDLNEKGSHHNHIAMPNYYFLFGPAFFLGYESKNKSKSLSTIIGCFINIDISILKTYEYHYLSEVNQYDNIIYHDDLELFKEHDSTIVGIDAGIEFRIGYNYFKTLK